MDDGNNRDKNHILKQQQKTCTDAVVCTRTVVILKYIGHGLSENVPMVLF